MIPRHLQRRKMKKRYEKLHILQLCCGTSPSPDGTQRRRPSAERSFEALDIRYIIGKITE